MTKYLWIALIACILIIAGFAEYSSRLIDKIEFAESELENTSKLLSQKMDEVEMYMNRNGNLVARNEAAELQIKSLKKLVEDGHFKGLKELHGLKKNFRNLESAYQITLKAMDSVVANSRDTTFLVFTEADTASFTGTVTTYQDKWATFHVKPISPFESTFTYSVDVPITGALYWKRTWFLGRKQYFAEVVSDNPNVTVSELRFVKALKR